MLRRSLAFTVGLVMLLFLLVGVVAIASGSLNVRDPEQSTEMTPPVVPPPLIPPSQEGYIVPPSSLVVTAPDGRPVAQFSGQPTGYRQGVEVNLPELEASAEKEISFQILASVRYSGAQHTVVVTTTRPSPEAAKQPMLLGNETIQLATGQRAWTRTNAPTEFSNQVAFLREDLIITVAGNAPLEELVMLAAQVIVP